MRLVGARQRNQICDVAGEPSLSTTSHHFGDSFHVMWWVCAAAGCTDPPHHILRKRRRRFRSQSKGSPAISIRWFPGALWDDNILQCDGIVQGIIKFIGLAHSGWSDRVHDLGYRVWIHCTVGIVARGRTHTELERLRCRGESTSLVRAKAILAGQRHREAPTRAWLPSEARRWHTEGDEARDSIGADRHRAHGIAMCVDVTLSESLHLNQPVPCCSRVNHVITLSEGCGRRGIA